MRYLIYLVSLLYYRALLKFYFQFEITGREKVPSKGPFILVANHVSYADPVVMGVACNMVPVTFMAKKELFDKSFLGRWIMAIGCIPTDRHSGSSQSLKKALKILLKERGVLGIFPEGTRSRDGKLQQAELGIGFLALKAKVPIIPLYIWGTDKVMPIGQTYLTRAKIKAKFGTHIDITGSVKFKDKRKAYGYVGDKIMEAIRELKEGQKNGA